MTAARTNAFVAESARRLRHIHDQLAAAYGEQHWWPAETPFEMILGAYLTQNTAWKAVERSLANQRAAVERWIGQAVSLDGEYFRSVEFRYMDPTDVLSGAGTRAHGGRFAAVGMGAVYLSATDSGAGKEVTARKARLGGASRSVPTSIPVLCLP